MSDTYTRAREFILTHARLLERLLFAARFEGGDAAAVGRVVAAYQNGDGGLGHALEPDLRCSSSQPLFAEVGLSALRDAGRREPELARRLCDYLETVCDARGLVPIIDAQALCEPRASHWTAAGEPSLNPTAGICGLLHFQQVEHGWLERATQTCQSLLLAQPPQEGHTLLSAAQLCEHIPDPRAAGQLTEVVARALPQATFYIPEAPVTEYGLTPLHFARASDSQFAPFFTATQLDGHLDELAAQQQEDGGWPIHWEAPGPGATCEWRARVTYEALRVLDGYGRLSREEWPAG